MNKWQSLEVEWYKKYGKYPERIRLDGNNLPYVVGDWGWNRNNPEKPELIEPLMEREIESRMNREFNQIQ